MPSLPLRTRPGSRLLGLAALSVGLFALPVGCETVHPTPTPDTATTPPTARGSEPQAAAAPAPTALPGKYATRCGHYVFYHDFEIDKGDPLFAELEELPDQLYGELRLPPANTVIQVFLFDTQDRYERFMRGPSYRHLPTRRAYMIDEGKPGRPSEPRVFTWMGPHLRTDLRHELTHALLRGVLKEVPLWLDEGLAGYFELAPGTNAVNPRHLELLRRGPFTPDLARLEKLNQVKDMEQPEYREAWAWVHLMLRGGDPAVTAVLHEYLQALRANPNPGPLLPRLRDAMPDPDRALTDHLARLEAQRKR